MNGGTITFSFNGDTKQLDKEIDNVKKNTESKLGSIASTIGKSVAVGTAAAVAGLTALTKASVSAYADYEQLTGGISTLYGTRETQNVEEYAKLVGKSVKEVSKEYDDLSEAEERVMVNAYAGFKTAGVSANKYMETVSGFAGALKQSVSDPIKLAEVADQTMIDMSDNANKMGSSMESIQNAYQGFAKQNYTMLDNLKLGYGGTKTEMERLLRDAQKISGVKYDIDNLADVYNAIHVIQTQIGITGTTAKEAANTITGSMNMAKASVENLMISFGTGENIDEALKDVLEAVTTFGKNIIPIAEKVIDNIVDWLPSIADEIIKAFPKILSKLIPEAIDLLNKTVNSVVETLPTLFPVLLDGILQLINGVITMLPVIAQGIADALPTLIPALVQGIISLLQVFNDNKSLFLECGVKIIKGIIEGLLNSIPIILENLPTILMAMVNFFNADKLVEAGKTLIVGLWNGLKNGTNAILKNVSQLVSKIISAFKNGGDLKNVGVNLIKGLWNGINSVTDWIIGKIGGFTQKVLKSIKNFFGIASPSKLMANEVGKFLPEGMAVGIDANVDSVYNSIEDMQPEIEKDLNGLFDLSPQLTGSMNNSISPIININSDIDVKTDALGQVVKTIKTSSGGAKNDYSFGLGM